MFKRKKKLNKQKQKQKKCDQIEREGYYMYVVKQSINGTNIVYLKYINRLIIFYLSQNCK